MKFTIIVVLFLGTSVVLADDEPGRKGLEIAMAMDAAESGYGDYTAKVMMKLYNRKGEESIRQMRFKTRETPNDGDRSIVIFDLPKDVRGFSALTHSHKYFGDDQWMYLPELRRVKRIASVNQSGPFVGSEFAYEDIGAKEIEQFSYKYIGEAPFEGRACLLIDRYPKDVNSGYSREVVWIDAERKIPLKIEYYDRKQEMLKTLTYHGYRQYEGRFWKPDRQEMINHQVDKRTVVEYSDYVFHIGLTDNDVSEEALTRLR